MSNYSDNVLEKSNQNTAWTQVMDLVHDNWTILDVGCSSGNLGEELIQKRKCIVDGIEIDSKDAQLAKEKLRYVEVLNVETATNLTEMFKDKYDAVLLIDVIEHLADPTGVLKKLHSLLKPQGIIIFSIPNMAHVSVRLALLEGDFTYTQTGLLDKTHFHFYTGGEIKRIFAEASYNISTLNCTSVNYPATLYDKKLHSIGLSVRDKEKFLKMISTSQGNVYQYIGAAKQTKKASKQLPAPIINPHERDFQILDETIVAYQEQIKSLEKNVKVLQDELYAIQNSRGWKLLRKAAAVKAKFRIQV